MTNEQLKEANIENVIAVGKQMILKDGVAQLTMRDVAENAGISQRTLNRFFHSKDFFIATITKELCEAGFEEMKTYCREKGVGEESGLEQLIGFFEAVKRNFLAISERLLVIIDTQIYLRKSEAIKLVSNQYSANFAEFSRLISALLERGEKDGSIRNQCRDKTKSTDLLINSFWGLVVQLSDSYYRQVVSEEYCKNMIEEYINRARTLLT